MRTFNPALTAVLAAAVAVGACNLPTPQTPQDEAPEVATAVAATLTELATSQTPQATQEPSLVPTHTPSPTAPPSATPTASPPPAGVSLNCDGTYQRVRLLDEGAAGRRLVVDRWTGSDWQFVWQFEGGDPMVRQLETDASAYTFGGCQQLIVAPLRYTGSGAVLELSVFAWTGSGMSPVYHKEGIHGEWERLGERLSFHESLYLYGEPNCCPCNRQTLEHTWNGVAFVQTGSLIQPTYTGTPPPMCVP